MTPAVCIATTWAINLAWLIGTIGAWELLRWLWGQLDR